jgi:hypothetical protein
MDGSSLAGGDGSSAAGPATAATSDKGAEDEQMTKEFRWLLKEEVRGGRKNGREIVCVCVVLVKCVADGCAP